MGGAGRQVSGRAGRNSNAFKHGRYTSEAIERRRELSALLREMRQLVEEVD